MHLYTRIALALAIGLVAKCSADPLSHDHKEVLRQGNIIYEEQQSPREARKINQPRTNFAFLDELVGLIIDFDSSNCTTGECLSQKECGIANGTEVPDVRCASGFGVCCITEEEPEPEVPYEGGDIDIGGEGGDFFNPGETVDLLNKRQACLPLYTANLIPGPDIVQIMIDIQSLDIGGPTEGDCSNDSLVITGANPGLEIPILCGKITDQQLYIGIDNSPGAKSISINLSCNETVDSTWYISIVYLEAGDARLAPPRCLQYMTEPMGTVQSFNFEGSPPMALIDQVYSVCFKYISGLCNVMFDFSRFDLGNIGGPGDFDCTDDFVLIGNRRICGDFSVLSVTANASTTIIMDVVTGSMNDIQAEGFSGSYTMLPCE